MAELETAFVGILILSPIRKMRIDLLIELVSKIPSISLNQYLHVDKHRAIELNLVSVFGKNMGIRNFEASSF